jgi:hypothetical protein
VVEPGTIRAGITNQWTGIVWQIIVSHARQQIVFPVGKTWIDLFRDTVAVHESEALVSACQFSIWRKQGQNFETVSRRGGGIYCCVPLSKSYSGKVHRIPFDEKYKPGRLISWRQQLRNIRNYFTAKAGTRVCSLHFVGNRGPKPLCPIPTLWRQHLNLVRTCTGVRRRLNFYSGVQCMRRRNLINAWTLGIIFTIT